MAGMMGSPGGMYADDVPTMMQICNFDRNTSVWQREIGAESDADAMTRNFLSGAVT